MPSMYPLYIGMRLILSFVLCCTKENGSYVYACYILRIISHVLFQLINIAFLITYGFVQSSGGFYYYEDDYSYGGGIAFFAICFILSLIDIPFMIVLKRHAKFAKEHGGKTIMIMN
jgi:hypothetical protein